MKCKKICNLFYLSLKLNYINGIVIDCGSSFGYGYKIFGLASLCSTRMYVVCSSKRFHVTYSAHNLNSLRCPNYNGRYLLKNTNEQKINKRKIDCIEM